MKIMVTKKLNLTFLQIPLKTNTPLPRITSLNFYFSDVFCELRLQRKTRCSEIFVTPAGKERPAEATL